MSLPDSGVITLVIAAIGACFTGIANLVAMWWQYQREGRAHQWLVDKEERDHSHQQELARQTQQNATRGVATLATKIDENTAVNEAALHEGKRAYQEANGLSAKILAVGLQVRAPSRSTDIALAEDTNATAHRIDDKLEKT